jgi:hypothetical protein
MTRSTHTIQRLAAAIALALALAVLTVPAAHAAGCPCNSDLLPAGRGQAASQKAPNASQVTDDGTLLSRASRHAAQLQQLVKTNPGRVTDGTLLSRASRQAALEGLAKINPGHVTDGMLLTKSALLYKLAQIDPGHGNAWTRVSPAEFRILVEAFGADVTTTMTPQQARAELARAQAMALHLQHEDALYKESQAAPTAARLIALHFQHEDRLDRARVLASGAPRSSLVMGAAVSDRFDWGDAIVGAGSAVALLLLGAATTIAICRRRSPLVHS